VSRPRLLFIAPWFLFPANTGGRIRTRDILRGLKGGRFDITLVSPQPEAGPLPEAELSRVCDRFVGWPPIKRGPLFAYTRMRYLPSEVPISVATDWCAAGQKAIDAELAKQPDVAIVDFAHTAVFTPRRLGVPSILFTHNLEAEIFRRHAQVAKNALVRAVWRSQANKMARFERAALARFDGVVAVSEQDRDHFRTDYGIDDAFVIPTGVDLTYFGAAAEGDIAGDPLPADTLVFTGSMDWMPNIDAIQYLMDEVWPLIAAKRPAARFVIVGRSPPSRLVDAAKSRGLRWEFTGRVEDVRPYVRRSQVYVIPLRVGGGTRLKVFEAMAMGCPVVSTTIGVEGLPLDPGRHYLLADTPEEFAAAVLRLLDDAALRRHVADEARSYVAKNFSTGHVVRVFEDICAKVAGLDSHASRPHMPPPAALTGADPRVAGSAGSG
jgi:glycosyltransferase involved in cell wall biosynthesis